MNKIQARQIIHAYAEWCRDGLNLTHDDWDNFLDLSVNVQAEIMKAREMVSEAWEHIGWVVWRPTKVWKS